MALQRLREWLKNLGAWTGPREELLSGRILPEGAALVVHHIADEEMDRLLPDDLERVNRTLRYIRSNPALNDGPAAHNKCPIVHKYVDGFLYIWIWGMSRMIHGCFADRLMESEKKMLRQAGDFSVLLLRVIALPDSNEVLDNLHTFPEHTREVLRMHFGEGMSTDAIADALRSTPIAIRRVLVRGLENWGDRFNEYQPIPLDSWKLESPE